MGKAYVASIMIIFLQKGESILWDINPIPYFNQNIEQFFKTTNFTALNSISDAIPPLLTFIYTHYKNDQIQLIEIESNPNNNTHTTD